MRKEKKVVLVSDFDLEKCLVKWMEILNLNDWEIIIKFNNDLDSLARSTFRGINRQAVIEIKSYNCFSKQEFGFEWDMEETIVHELLHIKFCDFMHTLDEVTDPVSYQEECLIESLARILIAGVRADSVVTCRKAED